MNSPNALPNKQRRVALIEDHDDLRVDLWRLLRAHGYVVDAYTSAVEYLGQDYNNFDGVIVSDMVMSGMSGVELQTELSAAGMNPPFIFISGESSDLQIISSMKNRTVDFLLKPFSIVQLIQSIDDALVVATHQKQTEIYQRSIDGRLKLLSPREREVFFLLLRGFNNQEIVASLAVSLPTAKQYKAEVMRKMGVQSLSALMVLANP